MWSHRQLDKDRFLAALHAGFWAFTNIETLNLNLLINRIQGVIKEACNIGMPRVTKHPSKKCVY